MNTILKSLLYGTALALITVSAVQAQNTNINSNRSDSTSTSGATSSSGSTSAASTNGNQQSINFNSPGNVTSTSNNTNRNNDTLTYGGGTNSYSRNDGDVTVRNVPQVYAPPVSGGNPCTVGVSVGASFVGFGAAAGGTFVDEDCAQRQKIAMIHNAGYAGVAYELMCNDKATYEAAKLAGKPCTFRPQFEPRGTAAAPPPPPPPTPVVQQRAEPPMTEQCYNNMGRIVPKGTPNATCGMVWVADSRR